MDLTDEQRSRFRAEGVVPPGWRWCPDCNGEGVISTMEANPFLDERVEECGRCWAERGIVPALVTVMIEEPCEIEDTLGQRQWRWRVGDRIGWAFERAEALRSFAVWTGMAPEPSTLHRAIIHETVKQLGDDAEGRWLYDAEWHAEVYRAAQIVGALLAAVNPGWWASWS